MKAIITANKVYFGDLFTDRAKHLNVVNIDEKSIKIYNNYFSFDELIKSKDIVLVEISCSRVEFYNIGDNLDKLKIHRQTKLKNCPKWYEENDALERTKKNFAEFSSKYIHKNKNIDKVSEGSNWFFNCIIEELSGDVIAEKVKKSSVVSMQKNASIIYCQDSQIDIMLEKACIWRCLNTQIYEMFDEAELISTYGCTVKNMYDNSKADSEFVKIVGDFRKKQGE